MKAIALVAVPFLISAGIVLKLAEFILEFCRDGLWLLAHRIHKHL